MAWYDSFANGWTQVRDYVSGIFSKKTEVQPVTESVSTTSKESLDDMMTSFTPSGALLPAVKMDAPVDTWDKDCADSYKGPFNQLITPPKLDAIGDKLRVKTVEQKVTDDGTELRVAYHDGSERIKHYPKVDVPDVIEETVCIEDIINDEKKKMRKQRKSRDTKDSYYGNGKEQGRKNAAVDYTSYKMAFEAAREGNVNHKEKPIDYDNWLADQIERAIMGELGKEKPTIDDKVVFVDKEYDANGNVSEEHVAFVTDYGTFHKEELKDLMKDEDARTRVDQMYKAYAEATQVEATKPQTYSTINVK